MLSTLLLMTVTLASSPEADRLDARGEAADVLRSALAYVETLDARQDEQPRLPMLLAAADAAARTLDTSALGAELRASVEAARSRDAAQPDTADRLEDALRRVLGDLEFEPIMEAKLPEGFPDPTPVGEIELKRYPLYRIARADSGGNAAFWQLFTHIQKNDIPMTAPVEMTYDATGDEVEMAFMYEYAAQGRTGPDGSVEVTDVEPMLVASLGCRGWSSESAMAEAYVKLSTWIVAQGNLEIAGPTRQFGYNGPSVPGARRYFEMQIPVRETDGPQGNQVVVDFTAADEPRSWTPVDDSVMGGVSASRMISSGAGSSVFQGELSLDNNGGFASVRCMRDDLGLAGARGLAIKVRGDGKTYKLRLRMDGRFDSVSYEVRFPTTAGEWTESRFDFSEFKPTWRGRDVPTAAELDPGRVQGLTVMLSDKQQGAFRLELASLSKI